MQMRALFRLLPFAAWLACACLFAAPAKAAVCQASTAPTVTFTILDVQLAVSYSYGTTVSINCSGAAGEGVTVCVRATPSTSALLPGLAFSFSSAQGSGTLDSTGKVTFRLPVTVSLAGMPASGTKSTSVTLQPISLDWDVASYACASTSRVQLPIRYPLKIVINNVCTIAVKTEMAFPKISAASKGTAFATGAVAATCTSGTAYRVFLSAGSNNVGGLATTRRMVDQTNPKQFITYGLYTDSARTAPWGWSGNGTGVPATQKGTGGQQLFTVYGSIDLSGQAVTPGVYSDMIIVSIAY